MSGSRSRGSRCSSSSSSVRERSPRRREQEQRRRNEELQRQLRNRDDAANPFAPCEASYVAAAQQGVKRAQCDLWDKAYGWSNATSVALGRRPAPSHAAAAGARLWA